MSNLNFIEKSTIKINTKLNYVKISEIVILFFKKRQKTLCKYSYF